MVSKTYHSIAQTNSAFLTVKKTTHVFSIYLPNTFSLGILTSSKMKLQVEEHLIPSLSSFLPNENPELEIGTKNPVIPKAK